MDVFITIQCENFFISRIDAHGAARLRARAKNKFRALD
jgi:hypothetical protein